MANYTVTDTELTSIANAIRSRGGTQAQLEYSSGFISAINSISTGTDTSDATMTSGVQMLSGVTAYSQGTKYTGSITSKSAQTYTPGTNEQTIVSGQYLSGAQTISGDANLVAGNIKDGVDIFGVTGTLSGNPPQWDDDVLFIDYDGTFLYSYTAAEFANLTEMPPNPTHTDIGLVADGWNWTLADAKTQVASTGECIIGQLYKTSSGDTEINIDMIGDDYGAASNITLSIYGDEKDGVGFNGVIYWGDGNSSTVSGTGNRSGNHRYTVSGNYTIKIHVNYGAFRLLGATTYNRAFITGTPVNNNGAINKSLAASVNSIRMGNGCRGFYSNACQYMYNLKELVLSSESTWCGDNAFRDCYSLTTLIFPNGWSSVGEMTDLRSLKNVSLSNSITSVHITTIMGARRIVLPYNLSNLLGGSTTRKYQNVERITFPSNTNLTMSTSSLCGYFTKLKEVKNYSQTEVPGGCFASCYALTELPTFKNPITSIVGAAFSYCTSLKKAVIPNSVQSMTGVTFGYCTALKEVTFPTNSSFTTIPENVLRDCTNLAKVIIPANVTYISQYAFRNCYSLCEIHFLSPTPPTIQNNYVFSSAWASPVIYVPTGSLSAYQSASYYPSGATWREE